MSIFSQFINICDVSVQASVLKLDTSILVTDTKPANIWNISVTLFVSKLLTYIEVKFTIPENISLISSTFDVSKDLNISKLVIFPQFWNIPAISVTLEVLNLSLLNDKLVSSEQP